MSALLVAILFGAPFQATPGTPLVREKPAILISWHDGYRWRPSPPKIWIAVWGSGRVLWRDRRPERKLVGGDWVVPKANYYEGRIEPIAVKRALAGLKSAGVLKGNWSLVIPDSQKTRAIIRYEGRETSLAVLREEKLTEYAHSVEDRRGVAAWHMVLRVAQDLLPAKRRKVQPPDWKSLL